MNAREPFAPATGGAARPAPAVSRRRLCLLGLAAALAWPGRPRAGTSDRDAVVAMVDAAVAAVARYGFPEALRHTPHETWARPGDGLYVFVLDADGTLRLHPDRDMQGRNVADTVDPGGAPFIRVLIAAALAHPERGSWTAYVWVSPATGKVGTKHTYSRTVGGLVVSAGYLAEAA